MSHTEKETGSGRPNEPVSDGAKLDPKRKINDIFVCGYCNEIFGSNTERYNHIVYDCVGIPNRKGNQKGRQSD